MKDVANIISQLEQQKDAIERAISALYQVAEGDPASGNHRSGTGRNSKLPATVSAPAKAGSRRLSPEGRKRIVEALKKRWAAKKAAEKKATAKKATPKKAASKKAVKKVAAKTAPAPVAE